MKTDEGRGREDGRDPDERRMTALGSLFDWSRERVLAPPTDEEQGAVDELIPDGPELASWVVRFVSLTVLSAWIAAFGLLADSDAVVIGAMLVAPLMTPITATAAATVTAQNVRLIRALGILLVGSLLAIGVGFLASAMSRSSVTASVELPEQILTRTFPRLVDLGIAITAGAAAGYIAPRRSVTSALPGVGIAVALVPPLATIGITLELGLGADAANALLLYLTNLAAIVFSAGIMLLLAGFRPLERTRRIRRRIAVTLFAVIAVAVPLSFHTRSTLRDAELTRSVNEAVDAWDGSAQVLAVDADVAGDTASVDLRLAAPGDPPSPERLAEGISEDFGERVELRLRYQTDELFDVSSG